jgi:hypothetical protein
MRIKTIVIAALAAALPGIALAADKDVDSTKRIDERQKAQEKRIDKGVESGTLNKSEAKHLEKGQARIDAEEKKAMKDGKMTPAEKARIEAMQDKQRRDIYKQNTDKQKTAAARAQANKKITAASPLADRQTAYEAEERAAMADGVISPVERVRLDNMRRELNMPALPDKRDRD